MVINGDKLRDMTDMELDIALTHDEIVFARTSPAQKLRIVEVHPASTRAKSWLFCFAIKIMYRHTCYICTIYSMGVPRVTCRVSSEPGIS